MLCLQLDMPPRQEGRKERKLEINERPDIKKDIFEREEVDGGKQNKNGSLINNNRIEQKVNSLARTESD